ncbi:aminotransferase class IV [Candidatus Omnitrophota bacterium]
MKQKVVCVNGKFVDAKKTGLIVPFDPGFLYGYGVFETMRSYEGKIFRFADHINRLKDASRRLGIKVAYSREQLERFSERLLKHNKLSNAYLRLNVWKGVDGSQLLIFAKRLPAYPKDIYRRGFKAVVSEYVYNERSATAGIKSLSYLPFYVARQRAEALGYNETILLNTRGDVCEGSRSNIFLLQRNTLLTPSLQSGCLPGITRKVVIQLAKKNTIRVRETKLAPRELYRSAEVFATNSLIEIMPVTAINKGKINRGKPGPITQHLLHQYRTLTKR